MKTDILQHIEDKKVMLISHWDTDGLSSIAKFKIYISPNAEYYIPPIGVYSIPEKDFKLFKGYDTIIILDIALQDMNIGELRKYLGIPIYVVDHHYHPKRNNAIYLDPPMEDGSRYLSNTLLIDHLFTLNHDLLTLLGIVGDIGMKIIHLDIINNFHSVLNKYDLNIKDIYKTSLLIDSNHIVNEHSAVYRAVEKIIMNRENPKVFLNDEEWVRNYNRVEKEIVKWVDENPVDIIDNKILSTINSSFYIISKVGRRLSNKYPGKVTIVVNGGFFRDYDQVYIRTNEYPYNIHKVIEYSVSQKYVAGGKDDVMGVILPKEDTESFIKYLLNIS